MFEESHPDDKLPPRPPPPANGSSGLDDSIRYALGTATLQQLRKEQHCSHSLLLRIGYGSESLMGAIGNLGVTSYLTPGASGGGLDQSTGKGSHSSAVVGLQEQVNTVLCHVIVYKLFWLYNILAITII